MGSERPWREDWRGPLGSDGCKVAARGSEKVTVTRASLFAGLATPNPAQGGPGSWRPHRATCRAVGSTAGEAGLGNLFPPTAACGWAERARGKLRAWRDLSQRCPPPYHLRLGGCLRLFWEEMVSLVLIPQMFKQK